MAVEPHDSSVTKRAFVLALKVVALTIILTICFMVAASVSGMSALAGEAPPPADATAALLWLVVSCFIQAVVVTCVILRSRWTGWKLVGAVFVAFFGFNTVLTQIETMFFLTEKVPPSLAQKGFVMGAITSALFAPLAVLILGKLRRAIAPAEPNRRLVMPPGSWAWKLIVIAAAYVTLYFTFGYFVAWRNPAVLAYYGGTDPGTFLAQIAHVWNTTPGLFAFQVFRAMLWTAFALPVIRMLKGRPWESGLMVGLLFAMGSSQLLLPNPFMPEEVAKVHLVETATSNFLFGVLVGWLLALPRFSMRQPLPQSGASQAVAVADPS